MLCSNCGKNEANVHYTHVVNGEKTEYNLCEKCAKKLGIDDIDFNMPISFSNFLSDFFEEDSLLPSMSALGISKCPKCGLTYDEFAKNGKFGCAECYNTFANKIESVLKNLHGSSKHRGRAPKRLAEGFKMNQKASEKKSVKEDEKAQADTNEVRDREDKIAKLNNDIKQAIKDERYEDAAKIRDEIKKIQDENK